ncbi:hypothetical protein D5086_007665 [Populus alba]|uniref:Uncharacterized protein n=1 Tax=Populus alba TaxID=43335 RepID=A0ACC4CP62_POPAL
MATKNCFLPALLLVLGTVASNVAAAVPSHINVASLNRSSFPGGFIFGTASSASQVQQLKEAEDPVYGIFTPIDIQVLLS